MTLQAIRRLRRRAAERVYLAYTNDETYYGIRARDVVQAEGHALSSYVQLVKEDLWASALEIALAVEEMGTSLHLKIQGEHVMKIGEGVPNYMIGLKKKHYRVFRCHGPAHKCLRENVYNHEGSRGVPSLRTIPKRKAPRPWRGGCRGMDGFEKELKKDYTHEEIYLVDDGNVLDDGEPLLHDKICVRHGHEHVERWNCLDRTSLLMRSCRWKYGLEKESEKDVTLKETYHLDDKQDQDEELEKESENGLVREDLYLMASKDDDHKYVEKGNCSELTLSVGGHSKTNELNNESVVGLVHDETYLIVHQDQGDELEKDGEDGLVRKVLYPMTDAEGQDGDQRYEEEGNCHERKMSVRGGNMMEGLEKMSVNGLVHDESYLTGYKGQDVELEKEGENGLVLEEPYLMVDNEDPDGEDQDDENPLNDKTYIGEDEKNWGKGNCLEQTLSARDPTRRMGSGQLTIDLDDWTLYGFEHVKDYFVGESYAGCAYGFGTRDGSGRELRYLNQRGGMHTDQDPEILTIPDDSQPEVQRDDRMDQDEITWYDRLHQREFLTPPRSIASRSRSRERHIPVLTQVARELMADPPSEYHGAWWSQQTHYVKADADHQLLSVLVVDGDHHIGHAWAFRNSYVADVIKEMEEDLLLYSYIEVVPTQATRWDEVARLVFPGPSVVTVMNPVDTRHTKWELYQSHREVPMISLGKVTGYALIPKATDIRGAQTRLNMRAPWDHTWTLVCLDTESWVIHVKKLPGVIVRMVRDYKSSLPQYLRGGMETEETQQPSIFTRPPGLAVPTQQTPQAGDWTWEATDQDAQVSPPPPEDEEIPAWALAGTRHPTRYPIRAAIAPSMRSDIAYLTFKEDEVMSIGSLKVRLADVLHTRKERIGVYADGNPHELLQEWVPSPTKVRVEDLMAAPTPHFRYLNVYHKEASQEFILRIHPSMNNDDVRLMLGSIIREDPMRVALYDNNGRLWHYLESMAWCTAAVLIISRGGMHQDRPTSRSPRRTISTTLAFGPHSDSGSTNSPIHEPVAMGNVPDMDDASQSSPTRARTQGILRPPPILTVDPPHVLPRAQALRQAGALIGDDVPSPASIVHELESYVHSAVPTISPPPGQPRRTSRPIMDGLRTIGRAFAAEEADAQRVLADIQLTIKPHSPMWSQPSSPSLWRDVESLFIPSPQVLRCIHPLDIREGLWEAYHRVRYIPVLQHGLLHGTVVCSMEVDMARAQNRLETYTIASRQWRIVAPTSDDWLIVTMDLPYDVMADLDELQYLRALRRGGNAFTAYALSSLQDGT